MDKGFENGYALLIAVDESAVAGAELPVVKKDVEALRDILVHPARCAYPPEQVKVLTGAESTRAGILAGLKWLRQQIEADRSGNATAIVYYSGHGGRARDGAAHYLLPYDLDGSQLELSSLAAADFARAVMGLTPKRLLVVLDCCHAGGMGVKNLSLLDGKFVASMVPVQSLLPGDAEGVSKAADGAKGFAALEKGRGRAALSSCQGEEKSYVRNDGKLSIFTYYLIEALTGHAEPKDGATEVLVSDVLGHVQRHVAPSAQAEHGKPQNPDYVVSGNFALAMLLGGKGYAKGMEVPGPLDELPPAAASMQASVSGSGAIAQGSGSVAAGERGVAIGGSVSNSPIITGDGNRIENSSSVFDQRGQQVKGKQTNIRGDVNTAGGFFNAGDIDTGGGDFVGRDKRIYGDQVRGDKVQGDKVTGDKIEGKIGDNAQNVVIGKDGQQTVSSVDGAALAAVIAPLMRAVMQESSAAQSAEAMSTVQAIQDEAKKGDQASDSVLAGLTEKLVGLVPGAVTAVVSAFGTPLLAGIAGPVTQYVLGKLGVEE